MNLDGIEFNDSFELNPSASEFVPNTPPCFLPPHPTPGIPTRSFITPLDPIWKTSSKPSSPQSNKKLIKFVQKVHFPKDFLNKCLRVLPPDVSLADVKYQPENFQEKWFDYLKQRQSEAVEKLKTDATDERKSLLLHGNFVENVCFMDRDKELKFSSVSKDKFVSSMTQVELDGHINKKFEDLSFFCTDFKEDLMALSVEDSQGVQM